LIVALIDLLPVLGTGTVLIPWGIIAIIQKDYFTGFALLILYAITMVIRNIIEPKIVGASIGLYPVATLVSIFAGFNIIGIPGMFIFPITVLVLKNLNDEGKINIWKKPDKED
jgi:predicted PurR-regulated permease PerM